MPFVDRPHAAIYYEVCGAGPPLVFAHGAGGNTFVLVAAGARASCRRWHVLTFDHRSFGRSRCARETSRRATSPMGWPPCSTMPASHARRWSVSRWAAGPVCNSPVRGPSASRRWCWSGTPAGILTPATLDALHALTAHAGRRWNPGPAWNRPHPALAADVFERDPARGFLYAQLAALNPPGTLARLALHEVMTAPAALADWSITTLLIGGGEKPDRLFAPHVLEEVAGAIAGARFAMIPRVGHSPYFEAPDEFDRFIGSVSHPTLPLTLPRSLGGRGAVPRGGSDGADLAGARPSRRRRDSARQGPCLGRGRRRRTRRRRGAYWLSGSWRRLRRWRWRLGGLSKPSPSLISSRNLPAPSSRWGSSGWRPPPARRGTRFASSICRSSPRRLLQGPRGLGSRRGLVLGQLPGQHSGGGRPGQGDAPPAARGAFVVGGHSASFTAAEILAHAEGAIDCVIRGEGEEVSRVCWRRGATGGASDARRAC